MKNHEIKAKQLRNVYGVINFHINLKNTEHTYFLIFAVCLFTIKIDLKF